MTGAHRLDHVPAPRQTAWTSCRPACRALLVLLPLAAAGCAQGPQPVVRKSAGPAAAAGTASAPAAIPAPAAAASLGAPAAAGMAAPTSAAAAPAAPAPASAALLAAAVAPGPPAPPPPALKPESDNARAVSDAKAAAASARGGGEPVVPDPGLAGAPPTGAISKTMVVGKLEHPESVVVIDDGSSSVEKPKTLVETARAEKARREHAGRSAIVITNKNLHKYAKGGSLTVAAPKKPAAVPAAAATPEHDEQFWRRGVLEIRLRLKRATEQVKELEQSAADWRRRFYAQDDPYVRDGQIKPAWDRVLDELRQAKTEIDVSRRELQDFLDHGRREGALPGWLREGIEQEPPAPPKPATSRSLEAIEPPVLKEPPMINPPPLGS